ncbi:haloacid dehalogenase type II [Pseudomonas entomophila]|uniref:haloacid dehalogenase type II n=1 Tax=Pseudomonas entomophila TaxID=312306 RepID=UPI0023D7E6CA|nr:haloacid dehalogenase type II [Pseudomonas entomophila]MDF0733117.1 haloacid dehalogenase type II [Pseudomonas entomophila]
MPLEFFSKPKWLTFDCYGTLIQWDEGLLDSIVRLLERKGLGQLDPDRFIAVYDHYEHELEQGRPHRSFREVSSLSLRYALEEFGVGYDEADGEAFADRISRMPPFPEVVQTLAWLKRQGFKLCIVSNTDDAIIAGNVAQLGGHIDRVVTAQQAGAYKPDHQLFNHAHEQLGVNRGEVLHICASPHLDLVVARDLGFHCIWIDRGTKRQPLADYVPDGVLPRLDGLVPLFTELGWASE